jgi:integration host factor subunit beta
LPIPAQKAIKLPVGTSLKVAIFACGKNSALGIKGSKLMALRAIFSLNKIFSSSFDLFFRNNAKSA